MAQTPESARPSIKDVARAAGVSPTLTSFALNDRSGVAPKTKARILAVAASLGYQADPAARALRTGSAGMLGLVVRNLSNPYFLGLISGAQESAVREGRSVLVVDTDYSAQ